VIGLPVLFLAANPDPYVGPWRWTAEQRAAIAKAAEASEGEARKAEAVRRAIGSGATTIALAEDYGYPLQFHGWVHTITWPGPKDMAFLKNVGAIDGGFSSELYLRKLLAETGCSYFTATKLETFDADSELKRVLESEAREIPAGPGVRVFDVRPVSRPDRSPASP
jgi:hypothetical protein